MMNLMSKTASKALRKAVGAANSGTASQKCKLTLVVKRIVLEGAEQGHISVELSRGLKAATTAPMPAKDGLVVLAGGTEELSIISTIERTAENVRCEKIFKLSVKLVTTDPKGKTIEGESRVLGAIEIDVSDFFGNGDPRNVQQPRSWSIPCRKGEKHITIETLCSARPVLTQNFAGDSDDSSDADISDGSDDTNLEQVFTGSDLMISALKFQSDSDYNSESDASPDKVVSPPMLGIGSDLTSGVQRQIDAVVRRKLSKPGVTRRSHSGSVTNGPVDDQPTVKGGVSDSPLNPVSLTVSRIQTARNDRGSQCAPLPTSSAAGKSTIKPVLKQKQLSTESDVVPAITMLTCSSASSAPKTANVSELSADGLGTERRQAGPDWSTGPNEITSPKSVAAKEELFQTLKSSLKVRDAQVFELQSETSRLQARLMQAERDAEHAHLAAEEHSKAGRNAVRSCAGKDEFDAGVDVEQQALVHKNKRLSDEVQRLKTQVDDALEQLRVRTLTIQQRDICINDMETAAAAMAADVNRKRQQMEDQVREKDREIEQCSTKLDIADREMVLLESELKESERKSDKLQTAAKCAEDREQALGCRHEKDLEKMRCLQDEMSKMQTEVSAKSLQVNASEAMVQELRGERDRLRREAEFLRQSDSVLKDQVKRGEDILEEVRSRSQKVGRQVKAVDAELHEFKMELESCEKNRQELEGHVGALQAELVSEKARSHSLQERMAVEELKIKAELRTQIEEMDGLLERERKLSEAKGQEHEEGKSKIEHLNQVLSQRVERLTADQTAASESHRLLETQCQDLCENLQTVEGELCQMRLSAETLEASKQEGLGRVQQLEQDLQDVAADRDAQITRVKAQEKELRQLEGTHALEIQALSNEHENAKLVLQDEVRRQREEVAVATERQRRSASQSETVLRDVEWAQSLLVSLRNDTEEVLHQFQRAEENNRGLISALTLSKATIARTEEDMQKKLEALQETQDELDAVQRTNDELVDALSRLRTENTSLHEAQERFREVERDRAQRAEEQANELEQRRVEEEESKRKSEEARSRVQREVEEAKSLNIGAGAAGCVSCAFCKILQAQEEMLVKGLSAECALLDMLEQRFPLLADKENQRITKEAQEERLEVQANSSGFLASSTTPGSAGKGLLFASAWLRDHKDMTQIQDEGPQIQNPSPTHDATQTGDASAAALPAPSPYDAQSISGGENFEANVSIREGTDATDDGLQVSGVDHGDYGFDKPHDRTDSQCARIVSLESELREVRANAELDATVAAASQRQLIAASEKMAKLAEQLEQLQSESLDKAPVDDAEMIQQLINARVAHAEAEGLALEIHRQNVELKHVVRRLKQKLTTMEVRLYRVVEEDEATTSAPIITKDDATGTFGVRSVLRKTLFGSSSSMLGGGSIAGSGAGMVSQQGAVPGDPGELTPAPI